MKIKKEKLIKISIIIIIVAISFFAMVPIAKTNKAKPWMKNLSDNTLISEMIIPGTHDSGAMHSLFDVSGKCQDMKISDQLKIGVRFLDIRLQLLNNELVVVHSFVDQNLKFSKVLNVVDSFLKENSSEFIIMSIKEDNTAKNSNIDFTEEVLNQLSKYEIFNLENNLPKILGEARGKAYILNRFSSKEVGIPAYYGWQDSTTFEINNLYIQDNYSVDSFEIKKEDIEKTFEYSKLNKDKIILNFTSCYLNNAFPPTYAGSIAKPINQYIIDYMNNNDNLSGIIIIDFVTEELVEKVYMENNYEKNN